MTEQEAEKVVRAIAEKARRAGRAEGLREGARLASEFCDAIMERPQKAAAATISGLLLARAEEVEREQEARGIAGDRCEAGNECGRAGCPECQQ